LGKVGFVFEFYDLHEIIQWCSKTFDAKHHVVNLKDVGKAHTSLVPTTFKSMLIITTQTMGFKVQYENTFINENGDGVSILRKWLMHPTTKNIKTY